MTDQTAPFSKKNLSVEIRIPRGVKRLNYHTGHLEASDVAGQTISLRGCRMMASINDAGQIQAVGAQVQVYNPNAQIMRSLCGFGTLGVFNYASTSATDLAASLSVPTLMIFQAPDTYTTLDTADTAGKLNLRKNMIFKGSLFNIMAHMQAAPDPFITIESYTLGAIRLKSAETLSFKGAVPAVTIAQNIANTMGLSFENNGVQTVLQNPYFAGDAATQLRDLAEQALFDFSTGHGVLSIWPIGSYRKGSATPVEISAKNGLLGYPEFNGVGVSFRTIYNPSIRFGDRIKLISAAPNVTGYYTVQNVSHHLSQELPGGPWESQIQATFINNPVGLATL